MRQTVRLEKEGQKLYQQLKDSVEDVQQPLLLSYCQAWSEYLQSTKDIQENGSYAKLPNGCLMLHPAVKRQQISQNMLAKLAKQLAIKPKGDDGKWAKFERSN